MAVNRITGMFSGMDTDLLIKGIMAKQQNKIDKISSGLQKSTWKRDAYLDLNNSIRKFKEAFMSALNPATNLSSKTAYATKKIEMANAADSQYASVKAGASAKAGSYTLEVLQLASGAKLESSGRVTDANGSSVAASAKLKDIGAVWDANGMFRFSVNGKDFNFNHNSTIQDVVSAVNKGNVGVTASYSQLTGKISFESNTMGAGSASKVDIVNKAGNLFGNNGAFKIGSGPIAETISASAKASNGYSDSEFLSTKLSFLTDDDAVSKNVPVMPQPDEDGNYTFKINGKEIKIEADENMTVRDIINAVNDKSGETGVTMSYSGGKFALSAATGTAINVENISGNLFGGSSSFTGIVNNSLTGAKVTGDGVSDSDYLSAKMSDLGITSSQGFYIKSGDEDNLSVTAYDIEIDENTTVQDVLDQFNTFSAWSNVTMSFENGQFSMTSSKGDSFRIDAQDSSALFGDNKLFGMAKNAETTAMTSTTQIGISASGGTDAIVKINGTEYTHSVTEGSASKSSNSFTLDGITYDLSKITTGKDADGNVIPGATISFTVSQDNSAVMDTVKNFVTAYNELISNFTGKYTEKVDKDYSFLTDEKKEGMSAEEIADWEKNQQLGLLRNDQNISSLLNSLSRAFSSVYEFSDGTKASFGSIGFKSAMYGANPGQIDLSEANLAKIQKALEENPEGFVEMMTGEGGLISKVSSALDGFTNKMNDQTVNGRKYSGALNSELERMGSYEIEKKKAQVKYADMMERYYKKFAALETMLSNSQGQSDWLAQQLGGLS